MNKQEFLLRLGEALSGLPAKEREERLNFYSEVIDDRMEEGLSEEEAVEACSAEEISRQSTTEIPTVKQKRQWKWWEIVLLALGVPVWGSLLIAAVAVAVSLYASLWAVIVSVGCFWQCDCLRSLWDHGRPGVCFLRQGSVGHRCTCCGNCLCRSCYLPVFWL